MRKVTTTFLLFVILLAAQKLPAQENNIELGRFRVLLTTGERLEGRGGLLNSDGLTGTSSKGSPISYTGEEIRLLDRCTGNKGGKGALIGGGIGLATAVVALIAAESEASSDPFVEVDRSKIVPVFLGITGVGALIGWAVGSSKTTWENVPLEPVFSFSPVSGERRLMLTFSF
jgi:hypothetical protein